MNPLCNHFNLGMWHGERNIIECLLSERESWDPPIWVKRLLMCKIKPLCSTYSVCLIITQHVCSQSTYNVIWASWRNIWVSVWIMGTEAGLGLISCFSRCPKYPTQWASLPCPLTRARSVSGHHFLTTGVCPIALIQHYHLKVCNF